MPLTDTQTNILAAYADTISNNATKAGIDPVLYASIFGSAGCGLITARKLQADAAQLRSDARTLQQDNETKAQALEAQAAGLEAELSAKHPGTV